MSKKLILFFSGLTALMMLHSCNSNAKKMKAKENFNWTGSVTAAKGYAIKVHTGYLATKDTFITALPKAGTESDGWDVDGQEMMSRGSIIPTRLSLVWVSFAEKKFWKLEIDSLPADKMLHLFTEGFYNTDRVTQKPKHETYTHIVVAVAPGGAVSVFLTGDWHRVEIAHYRAQETFVDVNSFYDNPDGDTQQQFYDWWFDHSIADSLKSIIRDKGIPIGLWDQYRLLYNYRFRTEFYNEDKENDDRLVSYVNGEEWRFRGNELTSFVQKPLPLRANFYFSEKWAETVFDADEMMAAFKELTKSNKQEQIEIVGKVGFMYNKMDFWVQSESRKIPLKEVTVKLWNKIKR